MFVVVVKNGILCVPRASYRDWVPAPAVEDTPGCLQLRLLVQASLDSCQFKHTSNAALVLMFAAAAAAKW